MSMDIIARAQAAAQSRSATTQTLIKAVRTNAFFPQASYRCPANDVATITVPTAGAASVINGVVSTSVNVPVTNTAKITWLGGAANKDINLGYHPRGAYYGGGSRTFAYSGYEFQHTGTQFEVQLIASTLYSGTNFRVLVNDKVAGTASVPVDGGNRQIRVVFPTSATRRIRIETCGGKHRGLNVAATSEVAATGRSYPLVTLVGDSFPEGTGASQQWDGEGISFLRSLGVCPANASVGGTGILNPGTAPKVNWQEANRLSDFALQDYTDQITGATPDVKMGVVMMSINDAVNSTYWGGAASLQEAITKALWVMIDHWNTHRAGKPLIVFGPTATSSNSPNLDLFRIRDGAQQACFGASGANVWFIDRFGPGPILRSGVYSTSTDQASLYTYGGGDPTHPNQAGHDLDSLWMAREARRLILTEFA